MSGLTKPVAGSRNGCLLGSGAKRESLANDDPCKRSPSHRKGGDEHASSDDHDNSGALVLSWRARSGNGGEDEEPGRLPQSTVDERDSATKSLDDVQTGESGHNVDCSENELDQEFVVNTS